ncbi:MAG: hypothetical protein R3C24_14105 [Cyanobacteriota/Melainabacteria group bacterium]|nr:hypothetical protein [Cyanobacteria bacterium HKST-UBA01]MCB9470644.1 hypothetical protein [Candidatus Obscuribacterales bacterium]
MKQNKDKKQALIGDLLVRADLITRRGLTNCLNIASQSESPIGQVLSINGFVTEEELNAGLRVQALIRERLLPEDKGIQALSYVRTKKYSLDEALDELGWKSEYYKFTRSLGDLLIDSGTLDADQLDKGLSASQRSGLPLARVLVLQGALSEFVAYAALTAQTLLRDDKIARDQAVGALRLTKMHGDSLEDYLEFGGLRKIRPDHILRLGEFFVLAELVSELDLLSAVETGLAEAKPIGQILVESGLVGENVVEAALDLQDLIRANKISPNKAVDVLKRCDETGNSVAEELENFVAEVPAENDLPREDARLLELVHGLSFLSDSDLRKIVSELKGSGMNAEQYLVEHKLVSTSRLEAAKKCRVLLEGGVLTLEQSIFAVHMWLWSGGELEDVLREIGWLQR